MQPRAVYSDRQEEVAAKKLRYRSIYEETEVQKQNKYPKDWFILLPVGFRFMFYTISLLFCFYIISLSSILEHGTAIVIVVASV